jgi:hypothetical protein
MTPSLPSYRDAATTLGLQASVSPLGAPQAAVVGIAASSRFEIIFDTVDTSRKVCDPSRGSPS